MHYTDCYHCHNRIMLTMTTEPSKTLRGQCEVCGLSVFLVYPQVLARRD